jgi:hypothetical protein
MKIRASGSLSVQPQPTANEPACLLLTLFSINLISCLNAGTVVRDGRERRRDVVLARATVL